MREEHTVCKGKWEKRHRGLLVTIQGDGLLFSIICFPPLSPDSPFMFTIAIMFFTDNYHYTIG